MASHRRRAIPAMSSDYLPSAAPPLAQLVTELNKLPGVGPKSAQRLAYFIIRLPEEEARALAQAIVGVKERITFCSECQNLTEAVPCSLCSDPRRDRSQICVVEEPLDVLTLERTGLFKGLYHVLHGVISPMNGVGPEELRLKELSARIENGTVQEIIIATNPTLEGEATAMYIRRHIAPEGAKVTHLARGLPVGGDLEYADELTLSLAFQGRREI